MEQWTELHSAARDGDLTRTRALVDGGAQVDAREEQGATPLLIATYRGRKEVSKLLLDRGADVNAPSKDGWTPLHCAALCGSRKLAMLLLDRGAELHSRKRFGETPLHCAARGGSTEVAKLLLDRGAKVDAREKDGRTPLYLATERDETTLASVLLDRGAQADEPSNGGITPLWVAHLKGHEKMMDILLQAGASRRWMSTVMDAPEAKKHYGLALTTIETYSAFLRGEQSLNAHLTLAVLQRGNITSVTEFWAAHNLLLAAIRTGIISTSEYGPDYWYQEVYKPVYRHTAGYEQLVLRILEDAKNNGLITSFHALAADLAVDMNSTWSERLKQLGPIVADIYSYLFQIEKNVSGRISDMEANQAKLNSRLSGVEACLQAECCARKNVEESFRQFKLLLEKGRRRAAYLSLVKLALSLVPVAGGPLTAGVDVVTSALDVMQTVGDTIVAAYESCDSVFSLTREVDLGNPKRLQGVLSVEELSQLPPCARKFVSDCAILTFGSFGKFREEVEGVLSSFKSYSVSSFTDATIGNIQQRISTDIRGAPSKDNLESPQCSTTKDAWEMEGLSSGSVTATENVGTKAGGLFVAPRDIARDLTSFVCEGYAPFQRKQYFDIVLRNAEKCYINRRALLAKRLCAEALADLLLRGLDGLPRDIDGRYYSTMDYIERTRKVFCQDDA